MGLEFPNSSRSYDATRSAVRFWGYDTTMEWSFFVTAQALQRMHPSMAHDEASMLDALDCNRVRIWQLMRHSPWNTRPLRVINHQGIDLLRDIFQPIHNLLQMIVDFSAYGEVHRIASIRIPVHKKKLLAPGIMQLVRPLLDANYLFRERVEGLGILAD